MTLNLPIARSKSGGWQPRRSPERDEPHTGERDFVGLKDRVRGGEGGAARRERAQLGKREAAIEGKRLKRENAMCLKRGRRTRSCVGIRGSGEEENGGLC